MVTVDAIHPGPVTAVEVSSGPRISFSAEFLEERMGVVTIEPKPVEMEAGEEEAEAEAEAEEEEEDSGDDEGVLDLEKSCTAVEFEFLSTNISLDSMLSADELFCEGKLLPKFWLTEQLCEEKLENVGLKIEPRRGTDEGGGEDQDRGSADVNPDWFMDEDPSPRPPKCTVLWKELLRLRKQRGASTSSSCRPTSMLLSPSSSSSSTSSSSSSMADVAAKDRNDGGGKGAKRVKKGGGLERTSSGTVRIRPMINVPICTVAKSSRLQQPLFPLKKGRVEW
ncbi:hypothetical protein MLD38_039630 [Melastoma candidum]|uniref:Uncharacterized protein n=1 Tax=Melastoma candidum TaxID=119954 RepID=A0ACB9L3F3_9MYRT|nr:hypothetical protein MLD38_039630 [Melastoma candidum]